MALLEDGTAELPGEVRGQGWDRAGGCWVAKVLGCKVGGAREILLYNSYVDSCFK